MKKIITALLLLAASQIAVAGTFIFGATGDQLTNADLDGKLGDLVTEKFTKKYPSNKWKIYIQSSTVNANSDYSALFYVSVGVAPKGLNGTQPARYIWERIELKPNVINATLKNKKSLLVEQVRIVLQEMMDECEKSPNCDIDK